MLDSSHVISNCHVIPDSSHVMLDSSHVILVNSSYVITYMHLNKCHMIRDRQQSRDLC